MQKTLIAVLVLAVIGAGLYYVLTSYTPSPDALSELRDTEAQQPAAPEELREGEVRGTILAVETEQAMVDGPVLILVQTTTGGSAVIAVPSMGLPTCAARANMTDAFALTAGQQIIAYGSIGVDGMIIPCESADHYLQVVEPN